MDVWVGGGCFYFYILQMGEMLRVGGERERLKKCLKMKIHVCDCHGI